MAVAEDMKAHDVDLATRVPEERCKSIAHAEEGTLANTACRRPVRVWNDQEQMLGIRRDMGLPAVLEVVVVVDCAAPLNFSKNFRLWNGNHGKTSTPPRLGP